MSAFLRHGVIIPILLTVPELTQVIEMINIGVGVTQACLDQGHCFAGIQEPTGEDNARRASAHH